MKRLTLLFAFLTCTIILTNAQEKLDDLLPVRGLELAAPAKDDFDAFVKFINDELDPLKVNTLLMRIDWNYQYKSRPELQGENPLTKSDIKKIVKACKADGILIISQISKKSILIRLRNCFFIT